MQNQFRRLRNLMFMFVFFCGLLSLSAFGGKATQDIKKHNESQIRSRTHVEVKAPKYKPITNYQVKPVKMEMKLLAY